LKLLPGRRPALGASNPEPGESDLADVPSPAKVVGIAGMTLVAGMTLTERQLAEALDHHRAGRLPQAEHLYRQVCAADPENAVALHRLGVVAHQLGRADAADFLKHAVALKPDAADMHNDLGVVLGARGEFAAAASCFQRAVALRPDNPDAHNNLGAALARAGKFAQAETCFERALALNPRLALAHFYFGNALRAQGRLEEAAARYRDALAIEPNFPAGHDALGATLRQLGKVDEAVAHYERFAALMPRHPGAQNNLAIALMEIGQVDRALTHYDRAIALAPDFALAHYNRGIALRRQSRIAEAAASFDRASAANPNFAAAELAACVARLPILYMDEAEIAQRRGEYEARLRSLAEKVAHADRPGELAEAVGAHQPFYLAYQGKNDRDLQALYGSLVCRVMQARYGAAPLSAPPADNEPIRVGIVSGFFRQHSNWKIPIKGWLKKLDRRRFQLFGYHTGLESDGETENAAALCHRFVRGPLTPDEWRQAIIADAPHVLIYPEVGMDPLSVRLAAQRLAPVQCNSWGHPDTSGFPTLDYFLSSDLMEPDNGQDHYTERLVRLPNLSIYYEAPDAPPPPRERAELGLRSGATVFWSAQSLPKYLPQFDQVFPRIAQAVGDCQFTFIEFAGGAQINTIFRARLERAFAAFDLRASHHCVFLPRLSQQEFLGAIGAADAVLDSLGWSGCNSILESLAYDLPVVTLSGALMRGRHAAAILTMMDVRETVTSTIDEYIATAVRVVRDHAWRDALRAAMARNKHRLYRDDSCVAALEAFLEEKARGDGSQPR
jgi:predicted O-linked N-acetylglucosamine transferase (SPINDLY family)